MIEPETNLIIPDRCHNCALLCTLGDRILNLAHTKEVETEYALTWMNNNEGDNTAFVEAQASAETAQAVSQARIRSAARLDAIDTRIEEAHQTANAYTSSCSGVLKVGTTKDNTRYTIYVCTSPRAYSQGGVVLDRTTTYIQTQPRRPK